MAREKRSSIPLIPSLRRLLQLAGRNRTRLHVALVADLFRAGLTIAWSHLLRVTFDSALQHDTPRFIASLMWFLATNLVDMPLAYLLTRSSGSFSERTLSEIRKRIAARLNELPIRSLKERHSGDYLSVMNADLAKVKTLTGSSLLQLSGQASRGIGALIYIALLSWQLTIVSLVVIPLMFFLLSAVSAPIAQRTKQMQEEIGSLNSMAQDGLNGLAITKSFNLAKLLDERLEGINRKAVAKGRSIARVRSAVDVVSTVVQFAPFLIAFGFGGYLAITGRQTFGAIFAFINLLNYVVNPLSGIAPLVATISESVGSAQRIFQVLDQEGERAGGTLTEPTGPTEPILRAKELSFAYTPGTPILRALSLDVGLGEKIAIVGPSGSGKSTLLGLFLCFYPVANGSVFLFNQDINRWQLVAVRRQMAFVSQDTYLFPVSIADNIRCGSPEADQAAIEQAAQAANIHEFITSLPEGYHTSVGERGAHLSGGQKQRLSLARAILKNAPILLLDEPTSALDSESEALVQEALNRFMAGRTSIIVAHRLSTIRNVDRVLVLDQGQIIEQGTHEELLARGGLYQELYRRQFGLIRPEKPTVCGGTA